MARRWRCPLASTLALATLFATFGVASEPSSHDLSLRVESGDPPIPEILREDLEREIGLRIAGCFRSIERASSEGARADIEFRLHVLDLREQVEYDVSLAERENPNHPPSHVDNPRARIAADTVFELHLRQPPTLLRQRRMRHQASRKPLHADDARDAVRTEWVALVAQRARAFLCRGNDKKLTQRIDRARAEADSDPTSGR